MDQIQTACKERTAWYSQAIQLQSALPPLQPVALRMAAIHGALYALLKLARPPRPSERPRPAIWESEDPTTEDRHVQVRMLLWPCEKESLKPSCEGDWCTICKGLQGNIKFI